MRVGGNTDVQTAAHAASPAGFTQDAREQLHVVVRLRPQAEQLHVVVRLRPRAAEGHQVDSSPYTDHLLLRLANVFSSRSVYTRGDSQMHLWGICFNYSEELDRAISILVRLGLSIEWAGIIIREADSGYCIYLINAMTSTPRERPTIKFVNPGFPPSSSELEEDRTFLHFRDETLRSQWVKEFVRSEMEATNYFKPFIGLSSVTRRQCF